MKGGTGIKGEARAGRPFEMKGEECDDHAQGTDRTHERVGECIGVKGVTGVRDSGGTLAVRPFEWRARRPATSNEHAAHANEWTGCVGVKGGSQITERRMQAHR